jgi:hypothetical protein
MLAAASKKYKALAFVVFADGTIYERSWMVAGWSAKFRLTRCRSACWRRRQAGVCSGAACSGAPGRHVT